MKRIIAVCFAVSILLAMLCAPASSCEIRFGYIRMYLPATCSCCWQKVSIVINCETAVADIRLLPTDFVFAQPNQKPAKGCEVRFAYRKTYSPKSKAYLLAKTMITIDRETNVIDIRPAPKGTVIVPAYTPPTPVPSPAPSLAKIQ